MDRTRNVVFVGCARNCKPHIGGVLENVARFAAEFREAAYIFVENDSADGTPSVLESWLEGRPLSTLIRLDGLTVKHPSRTDRIAAARNAYLEHIAGGALRDFDYLVIIDVDDVNAKPISLDAFRDALELLENDSSYAAVFACSDPVYYDVWALRHPEWCPADVWDEVRAHPELPYAAAVQRFVRSRQIAIPADSPPIDVQSAFGGLGIYRLSGTLGARYDGLTSTGAERCEHVPFNLAVGESGRLSILPSLRNRAPAEHLPLTVASFPSRVVTLIRKRLMNDILS
jgi:glycosyltransferase involved in cell wall biosynthesis